MPNKLIAALGNRPGLFAGTPTKLHEFRVNDDNIPFFPDGAGPNEGLVNLADGSVYGTTKVGGGGPVQPCPPCTPLGYGTIFRLGADGVLTSLHTFQHDGHDGYYPRAELALGNDGLLYGTTSAGGVNDLGTVFRIAPDGSGYTVLSSLDFAITGGPPESGLVRDRDGNPCWAPWQPRAK